MGFVYSLSAALGRKTFPRKKISYGVGGLLPGDPTCAYTGITDYRFVQNGRTQFITEAKRGATYPLHDAWYRRSRAAQALGALYYTGCPVLLYSSVAFKLLLKASDSDRVHVYPVDPQPHISTFYSGSVSSDDFVYVVGVLILSGPAPMVEPPSIDDPQSTPVRARQRPVPPLTSEKTIPPHQSAASVENLVESLANVTVGNVGVAESLPAPVFRLTAQQVDAVFAMAAAMPSGATLSNARDDDNNDYDVANGDEYSSKLVRPACVSAPPCTE